MHSVRAETVNLTTSLSPIHTRLLPFSLPSKASTELAIEALDLHRGKRASRSILPEHLENMDWQPQEEPLRQLAQYLKDSLSGHDTRTQKNAELVSTPHLGASSARGRDC